MSPLERTKMTPLEMAVWAATYAHHRMLDHADGAVRTLRGDLERERQREVLDDAKGKHRITVVKEGDLAVSVRCSCGFKRDRVPPGIGIIEQDPEEILALHLAAMGALEPKKDAES